MIPLRSIFTLYLILVFAATVIIASPSASIAGWNFIIPKEAFSQLMIESGSWVRYRIVDEAMHQKDTSFVYIAIPKSNQPEKEFFWLEMAESSGVGEDILVKLLLSNAIKTISAGDSIRSFINKMYLVEGNNRIREGQDEDFARLEENMSFGGAPWKPAGREDIECPGGTFSCLKKERVEKKEKRILMGKSTLINSINDQSQIWFSDVVPIFKMVKYFLMKKTETEMDPPIKGVPVSGLRISSTKVELMEFGFGADSLLPACN